MKWKGEADWDMSRYFADGEDAGVEPELKEGKDEADKHPKKPKGAYFCYAMAQRATVQEVRHTHTHNTHTHAHTQHPSPPRRSILAALHSRRPAPPQPAGRCCSRRSCA